MKVGTKSVLFGVHQFIWHPLTVLLAWVKLYGMPGWREVVCIGIHDWGYWGSPEMDGYIGSHHPMLGARIAGYLFGPEYYDLVLYHSRHLAREHGKQPSSLCFADKYSIAYEPRWFYILRALASGELQEYRENNDAAGLFPLYRSDRHWFDWVKELMVKVAIEQKGDASPYVTPRMPAFVMPPTVPKVSEKELEEARRAAVR